jgi:pimeloyl-ACP methyl ester carboxylesterase
MRRAGVASDRLIVDADRQKKRKGGTMPTLDVEGASLSFETYGSGPPLLLMSGTACDGAFWTAHQVPHFSRDYTVIAYDQRGTGKTVVSSGDFSTTRLAADAAALIERVGGGPAVALGHSMGGRVAQLLALNHPLTVTRLILASTGASFKLKDGISPSMCLGMVKKGYESYVRERSIEVGFSKVFIAEHPERVCQCIDVLMGALPPIDVYLAHVMSRQAHDTSARLKDIRAPTLVLVGGDEGHGNADTTHIASSRELARGIPGAQFVVLEGQGHFYFYSQPEAVHRVVEEFLATTSR